MNKCVGRNLGALGHSKKARESLGESGNGLPLPTLTEAIGVARILSGGALFLFLTKKADDLFLLVALKERKERI